MVIENFAKDMVKEMKDEKEEWHLCDSSQPNLKFAYNQALDDVDKEIKRRDWRFWELTWVDIKKRLMK